MKLHGWIAGVEDDGSYVLTAMVDATRGLFRFSVGFSPGNAALHIGDMVSFDVRVDSVVSIERLTEPPLAGSCFSQPKGISVEVVGRVSEVLSKDDIKVEIPNFGEIEVSLEYRAELEIGQWIRLGGCLSGEQVIQCLET